MRSLNRVTLIGHLGRDPESRAVSSGDTVTNFTVATSEIWKDKNSGEDKERTEWHKVVAWGRIAEIVRDYCRKGSSVYVEGQLQTRKWTDQSGTEKYTTEIVMRGFNGKLVMLDSKQGNGKKQAPSSPAPEFDDDIPF